MASKGVRTVTMEKDELRTIIDGIPEKVKIEDDTWNKEPIHATTLWPKKNIYNILEMLPIEAIEDGHLASKYDNAAKKNGKTPSVEDFKHLFSACAQVKTDDDNGILLQDNVGNYFYIPEGEYWTSSLLSDDVGQYHPISLIVKRGSCRFEPKYNPSKKLPILYIDGNNTNK